MKDLTKGKPSTLILSFALPVFLGNLLAADVQPGRYQDRGKFSERRCAGSCRGYQSFERPDHRISDGPCKWVCHSNCTEIWRRKSRGSEKIVCIVSFDGQCDLSGPDRSGTFVSSSDPGIFKCAGSFGGNCQSIYFYYYRRHADNISL